MNMRSMVDEFAKIAGLRDGVSKLVSSGNWKYPALAAGSILGWKQVEQAKQDYALGRQMRKRYEQQGG